MTGTVLLRIGRVLFDECVMAAVVRPTIADLQQEVAAAGDDGRARVAARWRGYRAFWMLVLVGPFAFYAWPMKRPLAPTSPGVSIAVMMVVVYALTPASLRPWMLVTIVGGSIFAIVLHGWYRRHPTLIVTPEHETVRRPEINLSAIPVGGNMGGLMFMVGSMVILLAGLPEWRWYFISGVLGGILTAAAVLLWHQTHPNRGLPQNRIVLR